MKPYRKGARVLFKVSYRSSTFLKCHSNLLVEISSDFRLLAPRKNGKIATAVVGLRAPSSRFEAVQNKDQPNGFMAGHTLHFVD